MEKQLWEELKRKDNQTYSTLKQFKRQNREPLQIKLHGFAPVPLKISQLNSKGEKVEITVPYIPAGKYTTLKRRSKKF